MRPTCGKLRMNELSGGRVEAVDIGGSLETRVHLSDEAAILIANQPLLDEIVEIHDAAPVLAAHEHDGDGRDHSRFDQIQRFEYLVQGAKSARKRRQCSRAQKEMHLAQ